MSGTMDAPDRSDGYMSAVAALRLLAEEIEAEVALSKQIEDFLSGRSHGEALFHQLYDTVLDEEIPASMLALVRG